MYLMTYLVSLATKAAANILAIPAQEDSMADAWIRQQTRLKDAIAQAKASNASVEPVGADDADAWVRQQARLREAIARAKQDH